MRALVLATGACLRALNELVQSIDDVDSLLRIKAEDRAALAHVIDILKFSLGTCERLDSILSQLPQFDTEKMS